MTNVNLQISSTQSTNPSTTPSPGGPTTSSSGRNDNNNGTDTIAAVTVAVVAVIIVLTIVFVSRALLKRRRTRQGERMDQPIPSVSTGIMGTPVNVYANIHRHQQIQWETVTPPSDSSNHNAAQQPCDTNSNQYNLPPPGSGGQLDSVL